MSYICTQEFMTDLVRRRRNSLEKDAVPAPQRALQAQLESMECSDAALLVVQQQQQMKQKAREDKAAKLLARAAGSYSQSRRDKRARRQPPRDRQCHNVVFFLLFWGPLHGSKITKNQDKNQDRREHFGSKCVKRVDTTLYVEYAGQWLPVYTYIHMA